MKCPDCNRKMEPAGLRFNLSANPKEWCCTDCQTRWTEVLVKSGGFSRGKPMRVPEGEEK